MTRFEDLQGLWQGQAGPAVSPADIAALTRSLHRYGRRQRWVFGGNVLLVSSILGWSFTRCREPNQIAALLLVTLAVAVVLSLEWRNQGRIARLDFTAPTLGFVNATMDRLAAQSNPFRRLYWPFIGTVVIAMNLMLGASHRIGLRLLASALPFGACELGLWFRRKRMAAECRPLLRQLAAMQAALGERFE